MNHYSKLPNSVGDKGFALLLTLILLSLLVFVLVAISGLTRIETRLSGNTRKFSESRQNALLALDRAIAQLQVEAGPDQRVTGTAEISSVTPDLEKVKWTGVWNSTDSSFRTWLVSGNPGAIGDSLPTAKIQLVGPNTAGASVPVWVPSEVVMGAGPDGKTSAVLGHIAYWVGDEGVKASLRSFRSREPGDINRQDWDQQRRARVRQESVLTDILDPESLEAEAAIGSVETLAQMAYVRDVTPNSLRNAFHDIAVDSRMVLADPSSGGLKLDLSNGSSGISWASWLALSSLVSPDTDSSNVGFHTTPFPWIGVNLPIIEEGPIPFVAPVVSELELVIQFDFQYPPLPDVVNVKLSVEFWNPYGGSLATNSSALRFEFRNLPDFRIVNALGASTLDTIETINAGLGGPTAVVILPTSGGLPLNSGIVSAPVGTPRSVSGTPLEGLLPRGGNGLSFFVGPPSTLTLLPPDNGEFAPIEVLGRLGIGSADPVFFRQVLGIPQGVLSTSDGFHHWRLNSRVRDPSGYGRILPMPDPRQLGLTHGGEGDPIVSGSSLAPSAMSSEFDAVDDMLNADDRVVLFDLPMRRSLSLGTLQHVPIFRALDGTHPSIHDWGNLHGDDWFSTLDQFFVSGFDYGSNPVAIVPHEGIEGANYLRPVLSDMGGFPTNAQVMANLGSFFLVSGGFNLNSVSVDAWKSILSGSHFGSDWKYWDGGAVVSSYVNLDGNTVPTDFRHAFFRLSKTGSNIGDVFSLDPTLNPWIQGVREIKVDGQIDELARSLVKEIKTHGPFGSIEDFARSGVLETAIESVGTDPDDDDTTNDGDVPINPPSLPYFATTRLTQADVLGNLAPFLSARSDTFLVRAYGDAVNPITEMTEARAWCEAVVQRMPRYVDPSIDDPEDAPTSGSVNETFGRRFEIVYFRWLSPDDI